MFEKILRRFREKIGTGGFVMTLHAIEEMEDEGVHFRYRTRYSFGEDHASSKG